MAGAGTTLVCCVLLVATSGLHLCCATELLKGLKGQSLSFPALHLLSHDIVRVTWRSKGTHIAEAKPRVKMFPTDFLPEFWGRLLIHPNNLSLEISPLKPSDSGSYEVVVDTLSDPTNPKTFHYSLLVLDGSPEPVSRTDDTKGPIGSTVDPHGASEPGAGDTGTQDTGGGQPPGPCRAQDRYCLVKGYLMAGVFVPLVLLVAAVHIMTRDKGTKARDEASAGIEPRGITAPQGPSPWQR